MRTRTYSSTQLLHDFYKFISLRGCASRCLRVCVRVCVYAGESRPWDRPGFSFSVAVGLDFGMVNHALVLFRLRLIVLAYGVSLAVAPYK